jgi:hypothetical protein
MYKITEMVLTPKEKPWFVDVYEYERGWGCKLDETCEFATKEEADAYVKKTNDKNPVGPTPDWYMMAYPPYQKK